MADVNSLIALIEDEAATQGGTISSYLSPQHAYRSRSLEDDLADEIDDERFAAFYEAAARDYEMYKADLETSSTTVLTDAALKAAVATIIAYFRIRNYILAGQMLTTARNNRTLNKLYSFRLINTHCKNNIMVERIRSIKATRGSSAFPNSGGLQQVDLYYAIHRFNWQKSSPSSRSVTISDRYDYDDTPYTSIANIAISTLRAAQKRGIIVPFRISQVV